MTNCFGNAIKLQSAAQPGGHHRGIWPDHGSPVQVTGPS